MNKIVFTLIILAGFSGCSSPKRIQVPESSDKTKTMPKVGQDMAPQKNPHASKAVWHMIDPLGLELLITSTGANTKERILIDKTLSQVELAPGEWDISGFTLDGKSFEILGSSKNFSFKLIPKTASYAGSIIVQCPTVGTKHLASMKKMSFFNRLTFKSGNNLCEMVIGNEFRTVEKVWNKLKPKNEAKLLMGF